MTTLDERTGALLERLETLCPGGGYHIFDAGELSAELTDEEVGETLACLADCRCVDVRYAEGGTYCVCVLPAGRAYALQARERARGERLRLRRTALSAFLGALAGGALVVLAALLVTG